MDHDDAVAFIRAAVVQTSGVWADLGAGSGVFTRALASLLGPDATVIAVDRDASSLRGLDRAADGKRRGAEIRTVVGDFTGPLQLPPLDGVVLANSLHYVPYADQPNVMRHIASLVVVGSPIVVVEYDRRSANGWVPYPISPTALTSLARDAGLESPPSIIATRPSQYGGTIYSALVRR